jgi:hypothetical protein
MDIKALYELKRQNLLMGYLQHPEKIDDALAYAYTHRLAPVFHEQTMRDSHGGDPFEAAYAVPADFMNELFKFMDECSINGNLADLEFYKLEEKFGGYKKNRIELIYAIEYARISHRFGDDVYAAIESNAPAEANSIDSNFDPSNVFFG